MMDNLPVSGQRLWDSLMEMARIGATPKGGCNRQTLPTSTARAAISCAAGARRSASR
jgi:hypothetical protein